MLPPSEAAWTVVDEQVHVRQSRVYRMNSVVLLDSEHTILVDPGVLPSELEEMAQLVRQAEPEKVSIFFTHGHWDHVLGAPWWPKAKVFAHDRCAGEIANGLAHVREERERIAKEHGETWPSAFEPPRIDDATSGQRVLRLGDWRLVLRDAPGHSDGALGVHLPELELLIAGDMLSDIEPPSLNRPPAVYRATLEGLLTYAQGGAFETLVPGHGSIAEGRDAIVARFRADLDYLAALERDARDARRDGLDVAGAQQRLASLPYAGKGTSDVDEMHRDNVKIAWNAARGRG